MKKLYCLDLRKARMVVECKYRESASIKSFAVKKRNKSNHTIYVGEITSVSKTIP